MIYKFCALGLRTRSVHCILNKRSVVNDTFCDASERPGDSQPCHNEECVGVWVLGEWSEVSLQTKLLFSSFLFFSAPKHVKKVTEEDQYLVNG